MAANSPSNPGRVESQGQTGFDATQDPGQLIRDIPNMDHAMDNFRRFSGSAAPFRDVPPSLTRAILLPHQPLTEPNWAVLLSYFSTPQAHEGTGNLQDLYMFVTRVALPNAVMTNRRLLLGFYTSLDSPQRQTFSAALRCRYDAWTGTNYVPLQQEPPRPFFPLVRPRPIMRAASTPNGHNFLQWLSLPPDTPPQLYAHVPPQMAHRRSQLDDYLAEDEAVVRAIDPRALLDRAIKVLKIYWWVCGCNKRMENYRHNGWVGIEQEVIGGH